MILENAINELVRDLINTILNKEDFAILAKDNGLRPIEAYADVDIMIDTAIGWESKILDNRQVDPDIDQTIEGAREIMVSIGFYRDDEDDTAMDNARRTRTGFMRETSLAALRAVNMGLTSRSEVRDISEVLEAEWEKRAQFDLTLSAIGTDAEILRSIESGSISGEFQTPGNSIPISVEVDT
jgi:hypothetical protein